MPETTSTPEADNVDKIDPRELAENVAAMAIMAYVIADLPGKLPRGGASGRREVTSARHREVRASEG